MEGKLWKETVKGNLWRQTVEGKRGGTAWGASVACCCAFRHGVSGGKARWWRSEVLLEGCAALSFLGVLSVIRVFLG